MTFCEYCGTQVVQPNAKFCPNCGRELVVSAAPAPPQPSAPQMQQHQAQVQPITPPPPANQPFDVRTLLFPGERIAWEMDFKEGVIHSHVDKTYLITNLRVLAIDVLDGKIAVSLLIKDTDLVAMDRHTSSTSVGGGVYHGGVYSGSRSGSSTSVGTLAFVSHGVERIKLIGVGDPQGIRNLFLTIKKELPSR